MCMRAKQKSCTIHTHLISDHLSLGIQGAGKPFHPTLIPLLRPIFQSHCQCIANIPLLNYVMPILHIKDHHARNGKIQTVWGALGICCQAIDIGVDAGYAGVRWFDMGYGLEGWRTLWPWCCIRNCWAISSPTLDGNAASVLGSGLGDAERQVSVKAAVTWPTILETTSPRLWSINIFHCQIFSVERGAWLMCLPIKLLLASVLIGHNTFPWLVW